MTTEWQIGQEVAEIGSGGSVTQIVTVTKVTATQVTTSSGRRWRASTGVEWGSAASWRSACIRPATDSDRAEVRKELAMQRLEALAIVFVSRARKASADRAEAAVAALRDALDRLTEVAP